MGTNNFQTYRFDCEASVPNDRVRAFALWEGWHGYDRKKYAAMLREAFQPFELFAATSALSGIDLGLFGQSYAPPKSQTWWKRRGGWRHVKKAIALF
jgi:hypothetical protein